MSIEPIYQIIISAVIAFIPVYIWGYIYYKKQPEDRRLTIQTFIGGMIVVALIMLYRFSWEYFPSLNILEYISYFEGDLLGFSKVVSLPIGIVLTFMFVGVLEEWSKHYVVVKVDRKRIASIDDAIEFSIIAALGFAFIENVFYFYFIWRNQGFEHLLVPYMFRSVFSIFAHILFSGIFGYFYGIAHFASAIWQEEVKRERHRIVEWFHKVMHMKKITVFKEEKTLEGLLIAMLLHAVFNIFLEVGWTFMMVPFLVFGYILLGYLFKKKENHKNYGRLLHRKEGRLQPHRKK